MSVVARRYYLRGRASLESGDVEAAIESLSSAVDLAPTFAAARVALAGALSRFGDHPRAAQVVRAGLGRPTPVASRALLWATLGDVLVQSGDFHGAEEAYVHAEAEPSFAARAAAGRARIHARLGRYGDAFAQLAKAARS